MKREQPSGGDGLPFGMLQELPPHRQYGQGSGVVISARYLRANTAHWLAVPACSPNFIVARLGARFGNQTSYQFCDANRAFGTPRGGRRTVPRSLPALICSATAMQADADATPNR